MEKWRKVPSPSFSIAQLVSPAIKMKAHGTKNKKLKSQGVKGYLTTLKF
jgi:hypothetical protein